VAKINMEITGPQFSGVMGVPDGAAVETLLRHEKLQGHHQKSLLYYYGLNPFLDRQPS
jgi:hypothetical protein